MRCCGSGLLHGQNRVRKTGHSPKPSRERPFSGQGLAAQTSFGLWATPGIGILTESHPRRRAQGLVLFAAAGPVSQMTILRAMEYSGVYVAAEVLGSAKAALGEAATYSGASVVLVGCVRGLSSGHSP